LQRLEVEGLEPSDYAVGPPGARELKQWRAPPRLQRSFEHSQPDSRIRLAGGCGHCQLEAVRVYVCGVDPERVASGPGLQPRRFPAQQLPQLRHVRLHCPGGTVGASFDPYLLPQPVGAHWLPGMDHQARQQPPPPFIRQVDESGFS